MPKKTARTKKTTRKVSSKSIVRHDDSFINWTHEHPLYFLVAVTLALIALIMVYKLVSIRKQVDELEDMATQEVINAELSVPKVSITPIQNRNLSN